MMEPFTYEKMMTAVYLFTTDFNTPSQVADFNQQCNTSGTYGNMLRRAMRRYVNAHAASKKYGLVGVGCITFADERLAKWARRTKFVPILSK